MFSKVAGKLWVDKQDLGWIKVDGQVVQPFSMALFLARVLGGHTLPWSRRASTAFGERAERVCVDSGQQRIMVDRPLRRFWFGRRRGRSHRGPQHRRTTFWNRDHCWPDLHS
jgi:hypothetical protein